MSIFIITYLKSGLILTSKGITEKTPFILHFLPKRQADLTVSALLRIIRSEEPQTRPNPLHNPRLAPTQPNPAISTREYSG